MISAISFRSSSVSTTSPPARFSRARFFDLRRASGVSHAIKYLDSDKETYDDPGNGRTCGPRLATHPIASCAGVMPFFSANARIAFAFARLLSKYSIRNMRDGRGFSAEGLTHLIEASEVPTEVGRCTGQK